MADITKKDESKISIKVIVDKVNKRAVYAEADDTFVDVLFSFMTLPMGTIIRLLGKLDDKKFEAFRSLNNLYQSLKDLPESYFSTEECKSKLLYTRSPSNDLCRNLKIKLDDMNYFRCQNDTSCCHRAWLNYSIGDKAKCRKCGLLMNEFSPPIETVYADGDGDGGLFVSDIPKFVVTDDFSVMPYSAAASIQLLADLGITDTSHLEGRHVVLGREQMLYLLKMALSYESPLTYLIFGRNKSSRGSDARLCKSLAFNLCDMMEKEASASSKMLLEVFKQKSTGKVLFAEAKADFVDFLFGFLSIPLGTVVGTLMNGNSSMRCMDNLFRSKLNMSVGKYSKSQSIKDKEYASKNKLFPLSGTGVFFCVLSATPQLKDLKTGEEYLKPGMFIVTGDLVISPSTSLLIMDALGKLKVKLNDIEKHELSIGLEEGLRIMKASILSTSAFTNIIEHQPMKCVIL